MQETDQNIAEFGMLEPARLADDENFRVYSDIDILFILRKIMQSKSLATLYFGHGNNFILTTILAINANEKELVLDYGANVKTSQQALQSKELMFITTQNKIKIEFSCINIRKIEFEGKDAFSVNLPEYLLRIQRRDSFRIPTPIVKPLKCIIPIQIDDRFINTEITLLDISCGGMGAIDQNTSINFEPGIIYENCQISLPEIGIVNTTIKVKNTYPIQSQNGILYYRIGCQFIDLPIKTEAMIQRYIVKQEQIRKIKDS
ncbi:MAG: flagellar brake protein [Nitrosomonas sp.]|nr:MAG: flagellar brake protein [Nitrosomonas sp.]